MSPGPSWRLALTGLVGAAVVTAGGSGAAAIGATTAGHHHHLPTELITFGEVTCAPHWYAPNKGRNRFRVRNTSHHRATIYLVRLPKGNIVGTVKHSRPGSTRRLTVRLRPGRYLWGCDLAGRPPHVSESERVPIDDTYGGPGTPVIPISRTDIRGPYVAYRHYVAALIAVLEDQVDTLAGDVSRGDVAAAEQDWLTAHLTWQRIGQDNDAYGAFGELGRLIDGPSAGLKQGTSDPAFQGFHKLELDLWGGAAPTTATGDANALDRHVHRLSAQPLTHWLPTNVAAERGWILRVHEILEDALRDTLSGHDDYGSGTSLASVIADIAATGENLTLLKPLVRPRAPGLTARAQRRLERLSRTVRATRVDDSWVPLGALSRAERESVDAALGSAVETLASIAPLLQIGGQT
jgi:iron uptake system EfeUOB component EfeO/EfeM